MWPSWLERFLSNMVAECFHVNLDHFKPRALKKLVIDFLRLGSSPPVIQSVRVHRISEKGDDAVIEMDISFVAADDMRVELIARLKRASVGFGLAGKLYGNNLRIEGRLRLGCKFVPYYPYLGQLTVAFVTVPILGLSVRPLSSRSVDLTDLPGIASWVGGKWIERETNGLDRHRQTCKKCVEADESGAGISGDLLGGATSISLDLIQLCGAHYGVDHDKDNIKFTYTGNLKEANDVGFAILEVLEGKNLEAKDKSGFADPYIKIAMEKMRFKTSIKKQTLHPVWHELFRIRISSWSLPSKLLFHSRDHDTFGKDDELGWCAIDLHTLRGGQRHDMWLQLQGTKTGQLHVAVTIVEPQKPPGSSLQEEEVCTSQEANFPSPTAPRPGFDRPNNEIVRGTARAKHKRVASVDSLRDFIPESRGPASSEDDPHSPNGLGEPNHPMLRSLRENETRKPKKRGFMFRKQRSGCMFDGKDEGEKASDGIRFEKCSERLSPLKKGSFKAFYKRLRIDTMPAFAGSNVDAVSPDESSKPSPE